MRTVQVAAIKLNHFEREVSQVVDVLSPREKFIYEKYMTVKLKRL